MGIFFAFISLFSWGLGDFLIQRSTRKFGTWLVLFFITAAASIVLLPFVFHDIKLLTISWQHWPLLILLSCTFLLAVFFDFEALRRGKISVVNPIYALEVPIVAILAAVIAHEFLNSWQIVIILLLFLGLVLLSVTSFSIFKKIHVETGAGWAFIGTIFMGAGNFLCLYASRQTNPLLVNWFTSVLLAIFCLIMLLRKFKKQEILLAIKENKKLIINMVFFDNLAWIAYAYSGLYLPLAIATGITESYIAVSVILGLKFNHEKLKGHQFFGLAITIICAIVLAFISE